MKKLDIRFLQKAQARLLQSRGMGYKKIANITGLDRDGIRYFCRDIQVDDDRQRPSGNLRLYCGAELSEKIGSGRR